MNTPTVFASKLLFLRKVTTVFMSAPWRTYTWLWSRDADPTRTKSQMQRRHHTSHHYNTIIYSTEWPRTNSWKSLHRFTICYRDSHHQNRQPRPLPSLTVHSCPVPPTCFLQHPSRSCVWTRSSYQDGFCHCCCWFCRLVPCTAVGRSGQHQGPTLWPRQLAPKQEQATAGSWLLLSAALPVDASLKLLRNHTKLATRHKFELEMQKGTKKMKKAQKVFNQ